MLKGLIASGKSTYANKLVKSGYKRVNKDDLRAMIDSGVWSRSNEDAIKKAEKSLAIQFLSDGHDVVVDDTNFAYEKMWEQVAKEMGAEFEIKSFDTPLLECIRRDAGRGEKAIGEKNIFRMYENHVKPKSIEYNPLLPDCYIFDVDGTLAHTVDRSPYDYTNVKTDKVDDNIRDIFVALKNAKNNPKMIVLSGRDGACKIDTAEWLYDNGIDYDKLFMRESGDDRKDYIIKNEIYENEIKDKYNVLAVFDDRNRVVELWRSLGIKCLQVGYGYF